MPLPTPADTTPSLGTPVEDADYAVEPPAVVLAVDVRTEEDRRQVVAALTSAEDVPHLVDVDVESGVAEPLD